MLKSNKYSQPVPRAKIRESNQNSDDELNLGQMFAALRRRVFLIIGITGVAATAGVLMGKTAPPVYEGSFEILTKPVTGEAAVANSVPESLGNSKKRELETPEKSEEQIKTTIKVLQSRRVLEPVVQELRKKYPELDYDALIDDLQIRSEDPDIFTVEYRNDDKQLVQDVLNLVAQAYLNYSLVDRQSDVNQAIKFVQEQISKKDGLRERVDYWQDELRKFRRVNNLVEPEKKGEQISTHIATLTQQQLENRVQLEQMVARYRDLQQELTQPSGISASNSVLTENARYQKVLDQIQEVDVELKKQSALYTDANPAIVTLQNRKANLLPILLAEGDRVKKDYESRIAEMQARDKSLSVEIDTLNRYLKTLATVSRDFNKIQQELKIATENFNQFLAKQQALEIEKSQKQQPWKLLNSEEVKPESFELTNVSFSTKQNLLLSTALGLLLGIGAALIVDKLSNVFYTSKELKDATGLPLLGIVPSRKELGEMLSSTPSSVFEVFRSLYTNILLLGSDTPIRSLVISSPGEGEGKSTIAVQLALAAAAMGQKVLLVDANLRCPSIHHRAGVVNIQGLTDLISSDLDWNNAIERSPQEENLFVLTAGPVPPDAVRLLASQKMRNLMDELHAAFDLVIYDAPPLVGFADAYLLGAHTDGVVLVNALGKQKRSVLEQALEEMDVSATPILGLVANRAKDFIPTNYAYYRQSYSRQKIEQINPNIDSHLEDSFGKARRR